MTTTPPSNNSGRKFLSILFACCQVYNRIYINAQGTAYVGRCPKCMRSVTARIDPSGSNSRSFTAI